MIRITWKRLRLHNTSNICSAVDFQEARYCDECQIELWICYYQRLSLPQLNSIWLEPALGIHHHSQLNAFNLADDIMEVFRPVVDLCVYQMQEKSRIF